MGRGYLDMDLLTARAEVVLARLFAKALTCARAAAATNGDPGARLRELQRTIDILAELRTALDLAAGGEIARDLDRLYEFASDRLMRAAGDAGADSIDEALRVLEPLAEAFCELASRPVLAVGGHAP